MKQRFVTLCGLLMLGPAAAGCAVPSESAASEPAAHHQGEGDAKVASQKDHGEVSSTLEIDREHLSGGPDSSLQATFTIRNQSQRPVAMTFSSGQQYDFAVVAEDGQVRWRWSDGKYFTMALVGRTLGEEPWTFKEEIPTLDSDGRPFPPGRYLLKARLVTSGQIENQIPFWIVDEGSGGRE